MTFRLIGAPALAFALFCGLTDTSAVRTASAADDAKAKATDEPKADVTELLQKGLQSAQKGDMAKAAELIGKASKLDPKNRQALFFLAAIDQELAGKETDRPKKNELLHRSAERVRALRDLDKTLRPREKGLFSIVIFNDACAYASEKKADQAMASLTEAVEAGYSDAKALAADKDLEPLRSRPDYASLTAKMAEVAKRELAELVTSVKGQLKEFKSFPFTFELPDLNGHPVKLADFKGKVTIVDVWGTWCPPCREEIPTFIAMSDKYKEKGLAIVGINYEQADKSKWKDIISSFVKENKINYPCVIGDEKTQEMIPEFQGFPTTLFVDRGGKVRFKLVGAPPAPVLEAIVTVLLDEPAPK
jgi:thiol-disulfide isomerase/thioredoxin